jgi:hypothetical protein
MGAVALIAIAAHLITRVRAHPPAVAGLISSQVTPLSILVLAVAVVAAVAHRVLTSRALQDRVWLEVRPSEEHNPSGEQVRQFAAQLARAHQTRGVRWLRAARGVRVHIHNDAEGVVRYLLAGPRGSRPAIESALSAYPDVEIHETTTPLPDHSPSGKQGRVVRCELVLARPCHEPLAESSQVGDLLGSVASAIDRLTPGRGEHAAVALDLQVASAGHARRLRSRMARQADPQGGRLAGLLDSGTQGRGRQGGVSMPDRVQRRHDTKGLDRKLDRGQVLIQMQLLLRVQAGTREGGVSVMRGLLAALDTLTAENHLRVAGLRVGGLGFLGADLPWRRRAFDRRMTSGRFTPHRRSVVTASEIACLLSPPTSQCAAQNVARSPGSIPAPPRGLPTYPSPAGDVIPLGLVRERAGERMVGVRAPETYFAYMAGRSRYGKTETAIGQFVALVRSGAGGLFMDPHADAIAELKSYLTEPGVRERVVEIDASDRGTSHAAWNLFAVPDRTPQQASARVEAFVDALATTLGWDERNARALNLATQSAQALTELAIAANDPSLAPTIFQVPTLLSDDEWREAALEHMGPGTREFFTDRFPRLPAEAITAVTNLIDRLGAARPVTALLGRPVSTYDASRALRDDLIVLACPGPGSTRDRLLANLLVYDVLHAARARASMPPSARKPFWVFLDELQTYDGPNLPALLEQSAKYGGRAFLFNQNPERLTSATWNAVSTNRSHLLSTTVNARAAKMIAAEWGTKPGAEVLTRLERYTYLASVTHGTHVSKPFLVHGVPARELHKDHHKPHEVQGLEHTIDETAGRVPIDQALTAAQAHSQRLREWLIPSAEGGGDAAVPPRAIVLPDDEEVEGQR